MAKNQPDGARDELPGIISTEVEKQISTAMHNYQVNLRLHIFVLLGN
jgi:hypothetical protein